MAALLDQPLARVYAALRRRDVSAVELLEAALARHHARRPPLGAYLLLDEVGARRDARAADRRLDADPVTAPPLCGIPISVKDLYGVDGHPVHAGTARPLPPRWSRDGWLVARLRAQGAVFTGRTHTVELAFGAVGVNPHHGTPRHPHDDVVHRIPGGSSAGAGASLVEGSALVALGTDTGGSIRIPASLSGTVGHKTTWGRWSTDGVVPLSTTLDTVGALTRSVADAAWFFGAVDPAWGDPVAFRESMDVDHPLRIGRPDARVLDDCRPDIARAVDAALGTLGGVPGLSLHPVDGGLLDAAERLYMEGGIVAAECRAFLERELPAWLDLLDRRVAERLRGAALLTSASYAEDRAALADLQRRAGGLFENVDLLALPTHLTTAPPLGEVAELEAYLAVNRRLLRPTCPVSALGLCALTLPVGRDDAGLPVGLQLVAPAGADERLLAHALRIEEILTGR